MGSDKLLKLFVVFLVLLLNIVVLLSDTLDNLEVIRQNLTNTYQSLSSYQADFKQINHWQEQQTQLVSEGVIFIEGEKFTLSYTKPGSQRIVIDDDKVYIIDDKDRTIIIAELQDHLNPVGIINLYWNKSKTAIKKETDKELVIILTSIEDPTIREIEVEVRKKDFMILRINYEDFDDNKVEFRFLNEKMNRQLDKKAFHIPLNEGYAIIDQSRD